MSAQQQAFVETLLARVLDPILAQDLLSLACLKKAQSEDGCLSLDLEFGYPINSFDWSIKQQLEQAFDQLCQEQSGEYKTLKVNIDWSAPECLGQDTAGLESISNVIAIASGKGGVGKSSTTVNLALSLASLGAKVGILDADIYGPSQSHMMGIGELRPEVKDQKLMLPIMKFGVATMSMGNLVNDNTPMVWRGPMAAGALQQLLTQTAWPQLDYLLIDMPPGTGDIQLTLSQKVPLSGSVVVTTPQTVALLDAVKGIEMFRKVNVPVLGVVENMSSYVCSSCGHEEDIFGEGGGARIAEQYETDLLGCMPLDRAIREDLDSGVPTVIKSPESASGQRYRQVALKLAANLWQQSKAQAAGPELVFSND